MEMSQAETRAPDLEEEVRAVLMETLQIADAGRLGRDTELLGSLPEFDSMAVVGVMTGIEERFGVEIDDDEVSAEIFTTVGTLIDFVKGKLDA